MITIKIHQYFYSVIIKFSRLVLTPCLTIDYFSLVDIVLRRGSSKTSWLSKGLMLLFELVIPLVHRADNKTATLYQQLFAPLEGTEVLANRNVGHLFGLYVGANSQNIDMEFLLAYALDTRYQIKQWILHEHLIVISTFIINS